MSSVGLILAVGVGFCSCFTPRTAPEPCDPNANPGDPNYHPDCRPPAEFKEPLVPEFVRDNIKAALERPTIDPNYRDSLSDINATSGSPGFVYVPDQLAEAAATPGFFEGWRKEREVQFMLNLLETESRPSSVELLFTFFQDTGQLPGTNVARYEVHYELTLTYTDDSVDPPATSIERYCGRAFWDLEGGDRNFWTLQKWEDLEPLPNPTAPCDGTMGLLRALSGQGS